MYIVSTVKYFTRCNVGMQHAPMEHSIGINPTIKIHTNQQVKQQVSKLKPLRHETELSSSYGTHNGQCGQIIFIEAHENTLNFVARMEGVHVIC